MSVVAEIYSTDPERASQLGKSAGGVPAHFRRLSVAGLRSLHCEGSGCQNVPTSSSMRWQSRISPWGLGRRVSPLAPRPREGLLTEPIAGAQPRHWERVLMPPNRSLATPPALSLSDPADRMRACGPPHLSKLPCGRSVICGERPATLRSLRVAAGGPAVRLRREAQLNAGSISSVTRLNWPFWSYPTILSRIVVAPASTYLCRL